MNITAEDNLTVYSGVLNGTIRIGKNMAQKLCSNNGGLSTPYNNRFTCEAVPIVFASLCGTHFSVVYFPG